MLCVWDLEDYFIVENVVRVTGEGAEKRKSQRDILHLATKWKVEPPFLTGLVNECLARV
jgi:hypothetical protein